MKIKDFKVGQTVVILDERGRTRDRIATTVAKVGRKYVTVSHTGGGSEERYKALESEKFGYLVEDKEYGERNILFSSQQAADEYIEKEELKCWFMKMMYGWEKLDRYTITQLRAVKKILDDGPAE